MKNKNDLISEIEIVVVSYISSLKRRNIDNEKLFKLCNKCLPTYQKTMYKKEYYMRYNRFYKSYSEAYRIKKNNITLERKWVSKFKEDNIVPYDVFKLLSYIKNDNKRIYREHKSIFEYFNV